MKDRNYMEDFDDEFTYNQSSLASIKNKIKNSKLVVKTSEAVACVSGVITGFLGLGVAGTDDYYTMVEKNFEQADASLANGLQMLLPFALITFGAIAVRYFAQKYLENQEALKSDLESMYTEESDDFNDLNNQNDNNTGEEYSSQPMTDRFGNVIDNSPEAIARRHELFEKNQKEIEKLFGEDYNNVGENSDQGLDK